MSVGTMNSDDLRTAMVNRLVADHAAKGLRMRPEVERALRTVPRELYTPDASLEQAQATLAHAARDAILGESDLPPTTLDEGIDPQSFLPAIEPLPCGASASHAAKSVDSSARRGP